MLVLMFVIPIVVLALFIWFVWFISDKGVANELQEWCKSSNGRMYWLKSFVSWLPIEIMAALLIAVMTPIEFALWSAHIANEISIAVKLTKQEVIQMSKQYEDAMKDIYGVNNKDLKELEKKLNKAIKELGYKDYTDFKLKEW